jgi:hypothetical protein
VKLSRPSPFASIAKFHSVHPHSETVVTVHQLPEYSANPPGRIFQFYSGEKKKIRMPDRFSTLALTLSVTFLHEKAAEIFSFYSATAVTNSTEFSRLNLQFLYFEFHEFSTVSM